MGWCGGERERRGAGEWLGERVVVVVEVVCGGGGVEGGEDSDKYDGSITAKRGWRVTTQEVQSSGCIDSGIEHSTLFRM